MPLNSDIQRTYRTKADTNYYNAKLQFFSYYYKLLSF